MKKTGFLNKKSVPYGTIVLSCAICLSFWTVQVQGHECDKGRLYAESSRNFSAISPEEADYLNDDAGAMVIEEKPSFMESGKALLERAGIFVLGKWLRMQAFFKKNGIFCKQYLYNVLKRFKN